MIKNRFFLLFIAFIVCLLSIPKEPAAIFRSKIITCFSFSKKKAAPAHSNKDLKTENHLLYLELARLKEWVLQEERLEGEGQDLVTFAFKQEEPFFQRRKEYLANLLNAQLCALPAKVIFREPATWSNVIWINIGERDNRAMGVEIVAKNSPVVIGKAVVGVVERVTESKSQVRLITDRTLALSVRSSRGSGQNRLLSEYLTNVINLLSLRNDLYRAKEMANALDGFRQQLELCEKDLFLAKGELHGASAPLWRVPSQTLKGVGFNYDFTDEEGPARNLRTGAYQGGQDPLIKVGDLLVTTGMDGVFPPDLDVATVTKIYPLHEGGCSYRLEAQAVAPILNTLSEVFVLPPQ